jgi:transcriptional regulator with GAF, ATPase, and Fis domain
LDRLTQLWQQGWQRSRRRYTAARAAFVAFYRHPHALARSLIVLATLLVCAYAVGVLWFVLAAPDIGVRCAFNPVVDRFYPEFLLPEDQEPLQPGDTIVQLGRDPIANWVQFLRRLSALRESAPQGPVEEITEAAQLRDTSLTHVRFRGHEIVRVQYRRPGDEAVNADPRTAWCRFGPSPVEELTPSLLWFLLKAGLVAVGVLVFWKRPEDAAARQFFLLCLLSCCAYMGGYHWARIVAQPVLLVVFIISAMLLPAVTLHFYLVFPRRKEFFARSPRAVLSVLYGLPVLFLVLMLTGYGRLRWMVGSRSFEESSPVVRMLLDEMLLETYCYFVVALVMYLLSILSLGFSYRRAQNDTERNQVRWILLGGVAALVPMGYSLYLVFLEQGKFIGGAAIWPMFFASLIISISYTISFTRYRLMQLDQLLSASAVYFTISLLTAGLYYAFIFTGAFLLGHRLMDQPTLGEMLRVSTAVLILLALLDLARGRIRQALDRHFRREKNQLQHTLQRMSQAVEQLVDPPTLARHLLQTTTELFGTQRGAVFLREGTPALYRLADAQGVAPALAELPPGCPLVEALLARPLLCSDVPRDGTEANAALRQLQFLGGAASLAVVHQGEMLALLVLGPKLSQDPYTAEELNLLAALGQVTALALVSGQGKQTIGTLQRELEAKVEKIAEQQRRILALQSQLVHKEEARKRKEEVPAVPEPAPTVVEASRAEPVPALDATAPPVEAPARGLVGSSAAMRQLLQLIRKVATSSSAVLLRGESGTGKELLARALHESSPRAGKPFVRVHCAALSSSLLESELFGHVKGAFTGAVRDRPGRFELADGGTLFLDEIGDISLEVQVKLLRVLQEMTFERVGSSEPVQVDVRIIAATHQDLEQLIRAGRFREDLFYRLNVLPIQVPPLRERPEDIPELVAYFLRQYGAQCGKPALQIEDEALLALKAAPWPGNIRQLENVVERAVVIAEGDCITLEHLPLEILEPVEVESTPETEDVLAELAVASVESRIEAPAPRGVRAERAERERREREQLVHALATANGNKAEAARLLGMARSTFLSRLKKYGLS